VIGIPGYLSAKLHNVIREYLKSRNGYKDYTLRALLRYSNNDMIRKHLLRFHILLKDSEEGVRDDDVLSEIMA
jgi:hypothetical protein